MGEIESGVDEEVDCPDCDGTGFVTCEFCDGSGKVDAGYRQAVYDYEQHIQRKVEARMTRGFQEGVDNG